jgi:hypothetical protein
VVFTDFRGWRPVGYMIVRHIFFMAQTLHFGKITCFIIFMQRDLSFGELSLVVSLMSWTTEISPKLKEFSLNLMHMLVVI